MVVTRRIVGIALLVGGLVSVLVSSYIKNEVAKGRLQISSAQAKVDKGSQLFSLSPATQDVGKGLTGMAQRKIDAGSAEANYYANLAQVLMIGGIAAMVVGAGVLFIPYRRHH